LHSTEVVQILAELKRQGLVRAVGASIYGVEQTRIAVQSSTWDVVQLAFNLMDQRAAEILPIAQACGVGVMVRSVLLKGILSDRGEQLHPQLMPVEQHRQVYDELIKKGPFDTLSELAIAFVLAHDTVSTALLGIDRMEYLEQALKIGTSTLDRETLERARKLAYPDSEFLDLSKWKHEGWLP
jgi:aryl-alcohol dehydrogenase-like predicted oxidoreductase